MHHLRYVVLRQVDGWKIVRGGRRYSDRYADKSQAFRAAISLARVDSELGHRAEVLVRHEDGRYVTEWTFSRDPNQKASEH
jgi:hypothetical protein